MLWNSIPLYQDSNKTETTKYKYIGVDTNCQFDIVSAYALLFFSYFMNGKNEGEVDYVTSY